MLWCFLTISVCVCHRLKTVSLVVKHSQSAEALVKTFEAKLCEEDTMNSDLKSIETVISRLKVTPTWEMTSLPV